MMNDSYWGMSTWGWIGMVLLWVLLILAIVWALRELRPRDASSTPASTAPAAAEDPLTILDRRLASGEIDPETYDELRDKLAEGRLLRR